MFKLNLKIALRNIWKYKFTNAIKLLGLVIGLSAVILLVSYVLYQLSFDRDNPNADLVYRIHLIHDDGVESSTVPDGLVELLKAEIPEIEETSQLVVRDRQLVIGQNQLPARSITADTSFFKIFGQQMLSSSTNDLTKPGTAVISERLAESLFAKQSPLGKKIQFKGSPEPTQIIGVIKNIPSATHFQGDIVMIRNRQTEPVNFRAYRSSNQYFMLKGGSSIKTVEDKLKLVFKNHQFSGIALKFIPVTKIHLFSHTDGEIEANGDMKYIYIFSTAAIFILFIALVNFINLTIAASVKRSKEIGVKKVLGASTHQLRYQFLSESYLYFICASFLAMLVAYDLIPLFSAKLGVELSISDIFNVKTIVVSLLIILTAGFIAGFYPAIVLSKLMPVKTLKGDSSSQMGSVGLKKGLMTVQFAASALLIVCTLVIYGQLNYMSNKNLGFDKHQVLNSEMTSFGDKYESFKNELLKHKEIQHVSLATLKLGERFGGGSMWQDELDTTKNMQCDFIYSDLEFLKTLNLKISDGHFFTIKNIGGISSPFRPEGMSKEDFESAQLNTPLVLNETAVKVFEIKNPIGSIVNLPGLKGKIIGVVKDFNGMSLQDKVTPVVINLGAKKKDGYAYVKVNGNHIQQAKVVIDKVWRKYYIEPAPNFQLMDDSLQKLYVSEMRLGKLFITFAIVAIFLCCIGLFGVVYFEMEHRTKEIAVRKILGASIKDLLTLLNSSFLKVVILANVIIWPIAYLLAKNWLNDFYYRIELTYVPFALAFVLCFALTILTVSLQALKTIKKSPVKALKYE